MIELPNYNTQEWLINKSFIGEIWKDIPYYDGLYQVSNLGRVRSLDRTVKSSYGAVQNIKGKIIKYKNSIPLYSIYVLIYNKKWLTTF